MSSIGGLKFQVDQTHLKSLAKAHEALETKPSTADFSQRLADGLKSVASAQNEA